MVSSASIPPSWTNQSISLYHGTLGQYASSILNKVSITAGNPQSDFGQGFYTTPVEHQAKTWAYHQSYLTGNPPAVIRFDVDRDDLADLDALFFVRGSPNADDFWSLIFYCHTQGGNHSRGKNNGWYDVIVGPMAALRVWKQRIIAFDSEQISFHTTKAANLLDQSNPIRIL